MWWCKPIAAHNVGFLPLTKYRPDFWHLCKSTMICSFCASIVFYKPIIFPILDFVILGITYNLVFNLFYNNLLLNKDYKLKKKQGKKNNYGGY